MEAGKQLLLEWPGVDGLGTIAMGEVEPLSTSEQNAFLADVVPPTGSTAVAAFNSQIGHEPDAFQSALRMS